MAREMFAMLFAFPPLTLGKTQNPKYIRRIYWDIRNTQWVQWASSLHDQWEVWGQLLSSAALTECPGAGVSSRQELEAEEVSCTAACTSECVQGPGLVTRASTAHRAPGAHPTEALHPVLGGFRLLCPCWGPECAAHPHGAVHWGSSSPPACAVSIL